MEEKIKFEELAEIEWEEDVPINTKSDKETFGWDEISVYL